MQRQGGAVILNAVNHAGKQYKSNQARHAKPLKAVFFERPATTGNAEDMKNTIAAAMATARLQTASGPVARGVALRFAPGLSCSVGIGTSLSYKRFSKKRMLPSPSPNA
jgi:hypothetical protein